MGKPTNLMIIRTVKSAGYVPMIFDAGGKVNVPASIAGWAGIKTIQVSGRQK